MLSPRGDDDNDNVDDDEDNIDGLQEGSRSMMKPIHSLMFNQLTHGNNNNNEHRHSQKRHKLINNNRNYISALRRRMKHTFRRSQSVFCGSLG